MTNHLPVRLRESTVDLPLSLERAGSLPKAPQLVAQLRAAILSGQVQPGTRLPSTRTLAQVLGISRGAVVTAYDDLLAAGCVWTKA
ncbi:GntR family transcriptional regulator [Deinococcus sp. QL22]|uniref:GntR family transcriptional regulator n=1 Tax=Deinococcus sp. QL22 TaxID=2939437 RepID=UPI0020182836|nr:winged helix-turn-helix domain-containing protein [Deinococcus sp. QL22]UQN08103.1 winged helix-turn-helix domain-containing protein [Deinococcus sp. QL22]